MCLACGLKTRQPEHEPMPQRLRGEHFPVAVATQRGTVALRVVSELSELQRRTGPVGGFIWHRRRPGDFANR
ncbi:hypothetical protein DPEC_G00305840 [Dallia pectoralis]|uniref:Uncharacterized protein n=1 Tax=Dallia pectoralis TaxID=75939 RepID=A0ACC2FDZ3_DALPE|nr:hypothetical protein DPEC_G00305840 [Dallia pectoralis]